MTDHAAEPSAWANADPETFAVELPSEGRRALVALARAQKARGRGFADAAPGGVSELAATMAAIRREVSRGRGLVLLRGVPVDELDEDEAAIAWFALGRHLGRARTQSARRDPMGRVERVDDGVTWRGYRSNKELLLHTDHADIVGLLCVRAAREGGTSRIASLAAVRAAIARERPDLLAILERGFPYAWFGEPPPEADGPASPFRVPVFATVGGRTQGVFLHSFIVEAARVLGTPLVEREREAIDLVRDTGDRLAMTLDLRPGEALVFDNLGMLHARTAFLDHEEAGRRRLLYRLWFAAEPPRAKHPGIAAYEEALMRAYGDPAAPVA